jgi:hypothetical protein
MKKKYIIKVQIHTHTYKLNEKNSTLENHSMSRICEKNLRLYAYIVMCCNNKIFFRNKKSQITIIHISTYAIYSY